MKKKASFGGESKDMRKAAAPKQSKKSSMKISARSPLDSMSAGAANSLPDRKSTRLNSSHMSESRMPSSA